MARVAFKMKLHEGQTAEYKARHDAIWPELSSLLKDVGVSNYSIFLDEEYTFKRGFLFAIDTKTSLPKWLS
jgi:L-rhamnose mutarotase